jgi:hypothetical protein
VHIGAHVVARVEVRLHLAYMCSLERRFRLELRFSFVRLHLAYMFSLELECSREA